MRCPHCNSPCRYIGVQRGAEKYYGSRMHLWTCLGCGTTLSQMEPLAGQESEGRQSATSQATWAQASPNDQRSG